MATFGDIVIAAVFIMLILNGIVLLVEYWLETLLFCAAMSLILGFGWLIIYAGTNGIVPA